MSGVAAPSQLGETSLSFPLPGLDEGCGLADHDFLAGLFFGYPQSALTRVPGWYYPLRMSGVAASQLGKTSFSFPAFRACGCPAYLLAAVCRVVLHLTRTHVWDVNDPLPQ